MVKYKEYIHSEEWIEKRKEAFRFHGKECDKCGANKRLHIHHKTYKRLGNENVEIDLVPLCYKCHKKVHKFCKKNGLNIYNGTEMFLMRVKKKKKAKKRRKYVRPKDREKPKRFFKVSDRSIKKNREEIERNKRVAGRKNKSFVDIEALKKKYPEADEQFLLDMFT